MEENGVTIIRLKIEISHSEAVAKDIQVWIWLNGRRQFSSNAARMRAFFVLLGFAAVQAAAVRGKEAASENPIRRIVNLLQKMQTEVTEEGEKDKDLHEKFLCYCEKNDGAPLFFGLPCAPEPISLVAFISVGIC